MHTNDHLNNMITTIRNGYVAKLLFVKCFKTKLNFNILKLLFKAGYIRGYKIVENQILILLKYNNNESVIKEIRQISTYGNKVYLDKKEIVNKKLNKLFIISTPEGLVLSNKLRHGGEILVSIY